MLIRSTAWRRSSMAIQYEQSVVTFLDILGFADVVRKRSPTEIGDMLDWIDETAASKDLVGYEGGPPAHVVSFSDSVIRARRYGGEVRQNTLLIEIDELAVSQWLLMQRGIWMRGGMTSGGIHITDSRAFGPAFVRAYELERAFANVPRIVIDPPLLKELRSNKMLRAPGRSTRGEISATRKYLRQGDDGLWYVDYLVSLSRLIADSDEHIDGMWKHREKILESAAHVNEDSRYLPKYLWLARYHNTVSRELYRGIKGLRIGRNDMPLFDELLLPKLKRPPSSLPNRTF